MNEDIEFILGILMIFVLILTIVMYGQIQYNPIKERLCQAKIDSLKNLSPQAQILMIQQIGNKTNSCP